MMGSPADELGRSDNEDLHKVTITQPFYIGVFEVTNEQFYRVTGRYDGGCWGHLRPCYPVVNLNSSVGLPADAAFAA